MFDPPADPEFVETLYPLNTAFGVRGVAGIRKDMDEVAKPGAVPQLLQPDVDITGYAL